MSKPNILFLFTDQQRWDTIAQAGHPHMITPNLDRLAADGVRFDYNYTPHPLCTPARASICTGCPTKRHGVVHNDLWMPDNADTWPALFTAAGYDTRAIGKMHAAPFRNPMGFEQRASAEDKFFFELDDDYARWLREQGYERPDPWHDPAELEEIVRGRSAYVSTLPEDLHIDAYVGRKAIEALDEVSESGRPFCHWVSFNSPHAPLDPPRRFLDMYEGRDLPAPKRRPEEPFNLPASRFFMLHVLERSFGMRGDLFAQPDEVVKRRRAYYYATITLVDHWIGKIIEALKEKGLYDNTIIVFASDHGDALGDHNLIEKSFFYESMLHVPLIVHCPAKYAPSVRNEFVQLTDLAPTFLSMAGLPVPDQMDGQDLTPLLTGAPGWEARDAVFSENAWVHGPITMIQTRDWKLVLDPVPNCSELFDLRNDPGEFENRFNDPACAEVRDELIARIEAWRAEGEPLYKQEDLLRGDYIYPVFPAREAYRCLDG